MTIGLLHTTESDPGSGAAVNSYFLNGRMNSAPHIMLDPASRQTFHFYDHKAPSKALANRPGGVETNNRPGGVFQVEIVGRAADIGGYDDEWYAWLKDQLVQWSTIANVEYVFHEDPTRFSFDQWMQDTLQGWFRHSNVPENDHWDPGTLDYSRLKVYAPAQQQDAPEKDPEMELTDKIQLREVEDDGTFKGRMSEASVEGALQFAHFEAAQANQRVEILLGEIVSLKNTVNALVQLGQVAGSLPATNNPINYTLIANQVADELARRIQVAAPK